MTARTAAAQHRLLTRAQPTAAEAAAHRRDMMSLRRSVAAQCKLANKMWCQHMAPKAVKK